MLKEKIITVFILLCMIESSDGISAEDPNNLAKEFTRLSRTVAGLKGEANFASFRKRQRKALLFYRDFLLKHPDSVYTNKVRWAMYSACMTLERKEEASSVLKKIQQSALRELLRISFAQKGLGVDKTGGQILEGILEKSDDGAVRATVAQFLWVTQQKKRALKILNEIIRNKENKYSAEECAEALLVKAGCYHGSGVGTGFLRQLAETYPNTEAGREGGRKLKAALLEPGSDAIDFAVTTTEGKELSLFALRGKPVLLYFWASYSYVSWKNLTRLQKKLGTEADGPVTVIAVACESFIDRPKQFLRGHGINWHLVAEGNKWNTTIAKKYDVKTLPWYVLIDAEGKIVTVGSVKIDTLFEHLK